MLEQIICPVCNQYRSEFVSISSINERFHGITVSNHHMYIDKICYPCRNKAEKEVIKKGKCKIIGRRI